MKRKTRYAVFLLVFVLSIVNTMAVGLGYRLHVNGEYLKCETPAPYEVDGVTLVPLRIVAEGLGCEVEWKNPNIIIKKGDKEISLTIDKATALVNGESISLVQPPILDYARYTVIYNNSGMYGQENPPGQKNIVMVPVRFISQALGATVECERGTGKINIILSQEEKLTLDEVKKLAQKAENLSWEDFEKYKGEDIGSGLYIMNYYIDDEYRLCVGGPDKHNKPMYIKLYDDITGKGIDIRYEDLDTFLENH